MQAFGQKAEKRMRMGIKAELEVEAVAKFASGIYFMAKDFPENEKLQAYARKVQLTAIMALTKARMEAKNGTMLRDRQSDCSECRRKYGFQPCTEGDGECVYRSPEWTYRFIQKNFGEDGAGALDALCEWAASKIESKGAKK